MSKKDDDIEYQENFEDEVWDEEQWEFFMQEADRKAEEYLKKFEEELLSKRDSLDNEEDTYLPAEERDERRTEEEWKESGTEWYDGEGTESFRNLAVWRTAFHFASVAQHFVEQLDPELQTSEDFQNLVEQCLSISAKIAGGHGMGYDREVLEGNIAYCKRGLKAAEDCIEALERIRIRLTPTEELLKLYGLALQTRAEVRDWIDELRRKIWWR